MGLLIQFLMKCLYARNRLFKVNQNTGSHTLIISVTYHHRQQAFCKRQGNLSRGGGGKRAGEKEIQPPTPQETAASNTARIHIPMKIYLLN